MLSDVAFVERKGIGHPDSVADLIAEQVMAGYRSYIYSKLNIMPNGWFDKVVVAGGESSVEFGKAVILKKPKIVLYGKAMKIDNSTDYMNNIFAEAVEHVLDTTFGVGTFNKVDVEVSVNSGTGAEHAQDFYSIKTDSELSSYFKKDTQKANDTVITSGWWPFNSSEKSVILLENYINSDRFKKVFPETGQDVKVVTTYTNKTYEFTICVPFIADLTPNSEFYNSKKSAIVEHLKVFIRDEIGIDEFIINLNTKDDENSAYLTVFGSAFDKGDVGVTGRGNRYPGVISVLRPSGVEAYSGKNTFNHSGKLYTYLAVDVAKTVQMQSGGNVQVVVTTDNGVSIDHPKNITILIDGVIVDNAKYLVQIQQSMKRMYEMSISLNAPDVLQSFRSCHGFFTG